MSVEVVWNDECTKDNLTPLGVGGIEVNAPGLIYAQGLRMNHGVDPIEPGQRGVGNSTVFGTGEVIGLHSSRDRQVMTSLAPPYSLHTAY